MEDVRRGVLPGAARDGGQRHDVEGGPQVVQRPADRAGLHHLSPGTAVPSKFG